MKPWHVWNVGYTSETTYYMHFLGLHYMLVHLLYDDIAMIMQHSIQYLHGHNLNWNVRQFKKMMDMHWMGRRSQYVDQLGRFSLRKCILMTMLCHVVHLQMTTTRLSSFLMLNRWASFHYITRSGHFRRFMFYLTCHLHIVMN